MILVRCSLRGLVPNEKEFLECSGSFGFVHLGAWGVVQGSDVERLYYNTRSPTALKP